jgi:hypothetical protein
MTVARTPLDLDDLVEHWTLLKDEQPLVSGKRDATRLGFAVLLKFYTQYGRFPSLSDCCETWDERVLLIRSRARQDDRDSDDDPRRPGRHDGAGWSGDR